jgi:hypothetical protein
LVHQWQENYIHRLVKALMEEDLSRFLQQFLSILLLGFIFRFFRYSVSLD